MMSRGSKLLTAVVVFMLLYPAYRYATHVYASPEGSRPKTKQEDRAAYSARQEKITAAYLKSANDLERLTKQFTDESITLDEFEKGLEKSERELDAVLYVEGLVDGGRKKQPVKNGLTIDSSSYRITKRGDSYWYFSSNVTISNHTGRSVTIFFDGQFLDESGFIIEDYPAKIVIPSHSTSTDRHQAMIEPRQAGQVKKFEVDLH